MDNRRFGRRTRGRLDPPVPPPIVTAPLAFIPDLYGVVIVDVIQLANAIVDGAEIDDAILDAAIDSVDLDAAQVERVRSFNRTGDVDALWRTDDEPAAEEVLPFAALPDNPFRDEDAARAVLEAATIEIDCPRCSATGQFHTESTIPTADISMSCSTCGGSGRLRVLLPPETK